MSALTDLARIFILIPFDKGDLAPLLIMQMHRISIESKKGYPCTKSRNLASGGRQRGKAVDAALEEAQAVMAGETTTDLPPLAARLPDTAEKTDY